MGKRTGEWVARGCRSCRRLAGLRPVAGKRPRSQDIAPRAVARAGEWVAWGCRSCRRLAGLRPVAQDARLPGHRSQGRGSGGGVGGSGVSFLSAPCGPSARCGQDARAPRTSLPGPWLGRGSGWLGCVAPVGALRAFGPLRARCPRSQDIAPRAVARAGEWNASNLLRADHQCNQTHIELTRPRSTPSSPLRNSSSVRSRNSRFTRFLGVSSIGVSRIGYLPASIHSFSESVVTLALNVWHTSARFMVREFSSPPTPLLIGFLPTTCSNESRRGQTTASASQAAIEPAPRLPSG